MTWHNNRGVDILSKEKTYLHLKVNPKKIIIIIKSL